MFLLAPFLLRTTLIRNGRLRKLSRYRRTAAIIQSQFLLIWSQIFSLESSAWIVVKDKKMAMMSRPEYVHSVFIFVKTSHVKRTLNCGCLQSFSIAWWFLHFIHEMEANASSPRNLMQKQGKAFYSWKHVKFWLLPCSSRACTRRLTGSGTIHIT